VTIALMASATVDNDNTQQRPGLRGTPGQGLGRYPLH